MTDMQYYSLLTNSGHQANIKAKALGLPIVLSKVAFGSGNITPTESATGLVKEEIRVNISSVIQNEIDKNILEIEAVIPSDVGGFMINEAALYLEDETLYAIINLPASYKPSIDQGAGKEFVFTILLASVGVENVTLKIDDSIVFATRKYVQNELKKYALINGDKDKKFKVADAAADNEAINKKQLDLSKASLEELINKNTLQPVFAGVATLTGADNKIVMTGIVSTLSLEKGDVIKITAGANSQNSRERTVESIINDNEIIVNYEHCGSRGNGSLKLSDESSITCTVKRVAKWFNCSEMLGQEPVNFLNKSFRVINGVYQNPLNRPIYVQISATQAGYAYISPDGVNWIGNYHTSSDTSSLQVLNLKIPAGWYYKTTTYDNRATFGTWVEIR